ncbi:hypothetical protein Tco_0589467, partial [Tanacetum coccineum]
AGAGSQGGGDAGVDGLTTQTTVGRGCKSQKSGHAGSDSQGGGDAGGSQTTQRTQS